MKIPPKQPGTPRVLLFSDLHLGHLPAHWNGLCGKRMQGILNHQLTRRWKLHRKNIRALASLLPELNPDLVLCGGDLTSVSLPSEFADACDALAPMLEWCGDGRFVYLPGNHDFYVDCPDARAAVEESFRLLNRGRWSLDGFPLNVGIDGVDICLLHAARPVPWFCSYGVLSEEAQGRFSAAVKRMTQPHRVVFSHFPVLMPSGMPASGRHGLLGADCVREALADGEIEAVLSGHVHHPYQVAMPSGGWQFCCGSLTLAGSFLVVDFEKTPRGTLLAFP